MPTARNFETVEFTDNLAKLKLVEATIAADDDLVTQHN